MTVCTAYNFAFKTFNCTLYIGEDWRGAMASGSSPLHIIAPTGFEIQLLKSIITDDALLATMRVEGTIPGFEINLSDTQVATLVKVLANNAV